MRLPTTLPPENIQRIKELLQQSQTKTDFQRVQCLWLQISLNLSLSQVALALGWPENKVRKVRSAFFKYGETALIGLERGGAKHRNLTPEEEVELLSPLWEKYADMKKVLAKKVHEAYEKKVGHTVPKSTIYRMMKRYGWQKEQTKQSFSRSKNFYQGNNASGQE